MKKAVAVLLVAVAGIGLLLLLRRSEPVSAPPPPPPPPVKAPLVQLPPPPTLPSTSGPAGVAPKEAPGDPLLRRWQAAIRQRNSQEVLELQAAFLAKEAEYREPLMKQAVDDGEPRVRAFSIAVLGRMKSPPPESFFVERLGDAVEHPRTSACQALERIGSPVCAADLDRAAAGDPAEAVRSAAVKAAKAVRSRGQ